MEAKGSWKGASDEDFRLLAAILRNLETRIVDWKAVGQLIGPEGIDPKPAQSRWEALRRRENNILQGVVINKMKSRLSSGVPDPKEPKKVSGTKRAKKEFDAEESRIFNTQNVKGDIQQPGDDKHKQKGRVTGKDGEEENEMGDLVDGAAKEEEADGNSGSDGAVYA